jgi:hypothetical protein
MAKTFKREVAVAILLYLFYLGLFGREAIVEMLVWPFMLYVGAAFGMDWARSQLNENSSSPLSFFTSRRVQSNGPTQEGTNDNLQRTDRQGKHSGIGGEPHLRGADLEE